MSKVATGGCTTRRSNPVGIQPIIGKLVRSRFEFDKRGLHARQQARTCLGKRDTAGRPIQQPNAKPFFQRSKILAQRRAANS